METNAMCAWRDRPVGCHAMSDLIRDAVLFECELPAASAGDVA